MIKNPKKKKCLLNASPTKPLFIVAGGTGGHVFPAWALACYWVDNQRGEGEVVFWTDPRGYQVLQAADVSLHPHIHIRVMPLRSRQNPLGFYFSLLHCFWRGLGQICTGRPAGVVGFGGYPALTWGLLAGLFRVPLVIHEQNAILGRTNRLLAYWAKSIAIGFDDPLKALKIQYPNAVVSCTGTPVRGPFEKRPYLLPNDTDNLFHLVVLGGSQGARIFSDVVPEAIARLSVRDQKRLRITQQCASVTGDLEDLQKKYRKTNASVTIAPFFKDIPHLLGKAHCVIARSGASTLSELSVVGRPALLVPFPAARDDHQMANARAFTAKERGWIIPQHNLTPQRLAVFLENILNCPQSLIWAAESAAAQSSVKALEKLSQLVMTCVNGNNAKE